MPRKTAFNDKRFYNDILWWASLRENPSLSENAVTWCAFMSLCFRDLGIVKEYLDTGKIHPETRIEFDRAYEKWSALFARDFYPMG